VNSLPIKNGSTYVNISFLGKISFRLKAFLIAVVEGPNLHDKHLVLENATK
jgi:hypothetical protein